MAAITITFGDRAENHKGMEILGEAAAEGLTYGDLLAARAAFEAQGYPCEVIDLVEAAGGPEALGGGPGYNYPPPEAAHILVVPGGAAALLGVRRLGDDLPAQAATAALHAEQRALDPDKKALMRGAVKNKHARWNLCFSDEGHPPDYEAGRGRVVAFDEVPHTAAMRAALPEFFGEKAAALQAEGNYYHDVRKCGIGFHGDAERAIVVAVRLGAQIPLHMQWFARHRPVGERIALDVPPGSVYAFGAKAVGRDWMRPSILTLRHAAGADKYLVTR